MENERILNKLIALEAMGLTIVENCQAMRKEISPDVKKKRKKGGLSEADILRMEQQAKAVWIRRGQREEAKRKAEQEASKPVTKPVTISKKNA